MTMYTVRTVFTARYNTHSAVLLRQVVRLSVRLSATPSVCLSVTLRYRGHIGWNTWKMISCLIGVGFLLADFNITDLLQRERRKFWPE